MTEIRCSRCEARRESKPLKDGSPRLPRGWQRIEAGPHAGVWCEDCWGARFVMRAITLPIAGPVADGEGQEAAWEALRDRVRKCWRLATDLTNWIVTELARHEGYRDPETGRLPPRPAVDLYQGSKGPFPGADPCTVSAMIQAVGSKYNAHRIAVFRDGTESLPLGRFPQPYPIRADAWEAAMDDTGVITASMRIEGVWWTVRVRRGRELDYQVGRLLSVLRDGVKHGEASLVGYPVGADGNRGGLTLRLSRRGLRPLDYRAMLKVSAWVERKAVEVDADRVLYLATGTDTLWTYRVGRGEPLHYHGDDIRRAERSLGAIRDLARRARRLERASERAGERFRDDLKFERRSPSKRRRRINNHLSTRSEKFRDRMDTITHTIAKIMAEFCGRRRVGRVVYDDTNRAFSSRFPWAQLADRLRMKLEERGIAFERGEADEAGENLAG